MSAQQIDANVNRRAQVRSALGVARVALFTVALLTLTPALAHAKRDKPAPPVPPTHEIEIIDPQADPLGRAAVVLKEVTERGEIEVDIPPSVLVHRYYYTGNRSFQAQFLPGGPTIVVVNHPKSNERLYLPVQMLPGAPRVTYTGHTIEYDFGHYAVTICFGLFGKPKVVYRSHKAMDTRLREAGECVQETTKEVAEHCGLKEGAAQVAECTKGALSTAVAGTRGAVKVAATPVIQAARIMPLAQTLKSTAEHRVEREARRARDISVREATRASYKAEATINTLR